jgi:hypothetical protein
MKKISTHVCLDTELLQWLKLEAERQHASMAQIIRLAVIEMRDRSKNK